ncbi:uncharacterized protein EDB91DRAFT_1254427 [Suillus paluster]|uniref:uncharacterized protein n=1 Tax=Suillus paluster TaxID=48578 RepID=UPI001B87454A|nr:uncharacterized protein EDB91DRAFT_1254427 [Suillus paluster]KAG1726168.1 hypothetical protein EDB91DRAFT_1254427 [Suillus paluster]
MVNSFPSARQRTRAQTAAFLLGVHPEPPNVNKDEVSSMRAVRHFYEGMDEELFTAQRDNVQLKKIEFRVPLHTTDRDKWTTYVGQSYSKSDCHLDIFDTIKATMDVPKEFQHLGWRLSTARRMDPPHRLLTSLDIDSAFKATRAEQSSGRNKKVVAIEVVNTDPVPKDFKQTKRKAVVSSSGKQSPSSLVSYTRSWRKSRDTFCWVDSSLPNAPHYPLCTQDLQEWARYLLETGDPDNSCVTLPSTPHFDKVRKTHKERTTSPLQRVPTEIISLIIHNHIHLLSSSNDISDGVLAREQGEGRMAPQPLKRTFALYMDSDEESDNEEPPQHIKDVLTNVHLRYPAMNFPQYANKLKDCGILYLPTAAHFGVKFYEKKVGMSEGAAYTFQSCVSKTHLKAELAKGRRKAKGKKKA